MPSTVLFLSPLRKASGNHSTIQRIRTLLESDALNCLQWDPADFHNEEEFLSKLKESPVDFIIALHAYRAGQFLSDKVPVEYILIFGGTDINQFHEDDNKLTLMTRAVKAARYIITFSAQMMDRALQIWPDLDKSKAVTIKQGIQTMPSSLNLRDVLVERGHVSSSEAGKAYIFLFVGSIRPVKDPLYLVNIMAEWHKERKDVLYVIIGPKQDEDYFSSFKTKIASTTGIIYMGEMSIEDTHACMKHSNALVNTSESEGMAAVVLEAMGLGTLVIARRNEGNESLIQHGVTGFLFSSPQEFKDIAEKLMDDDKAQRRVTLEAKDQILKEHSPETEKNAYLKVINNLKHTKSKHKL
eukprot:XP_011426370.1 PREDICTED: glycosyltransferase 1 domain-containing protein 1-like [Crassostrea gigas]